MSHEPIFPVVSDSSVHIPLAPLCYHLVLLLLSFIPINALGRLHD